MSTTKTARPASDEIPPAQQKSFGHLTPWASLAARIVGASVFAIAALSKIGDPAGAVRAVRAYRLVPESFVHPVAYALPAFEIALAILLFLGVATRLVGAIAVAAIGLFGIAIGSAAIRGLRIDCGCFGGGGQVAHTHYLLEIGRDVALLLVLLVVPLAKRSRYSLDEYVIHRSDLATSKRVVGSNVRRRKSAQLRELQARQAKMRRSRLVSTVACVALGVAMLGGIAANSSNHSVSKAAVVTPRGVTASGGIVVGNPAAPVKLIEYEDPQCPVCKQLEQIEGPTLQQAVASGHVSVEYRMRSFLGPESVRADNALAAAQQEGKFAALREAVFAHQPPERSGGFTTDDLLALGRSVGLTDAAFVDDVRSMTYAAWVAGVDDRASRDGNVGTPEIIKVGSGALSTAQLFDPAQFKAALGLS